MNNNIINNNDAGVKKIARNNNNNIWTYTFKVSSIPFYLLTSCIWPMYITLTDSNSQWQNGPRSNRNKRVICTARFLELKPCLQVKLGIITWTLYFAGFHALCRG